MFWKSSCSHGQVQVGISPVDLKLRIIQEELWTLLAVKNALRHEKQHIPGTTVSIYCDTSAGKPRPYIPAPLRLQVFQSVHNLSHPGTKATAKLVAQRFMWPGIQKDCRTWARACQATVLSATLTMIPTTRTAHACRRIHFVDITAETS
jgi:hypothetical protein